jgi:hypothetical protein
MVSSAPSITYPATSGHRAPFAPASAVAMNGVSPPARIEAISRPAAAPV